MIWSMINNHGMIQTLSFVIHCTPRHDKWWVNYPQLPLPQLLSHRDRYISWYWLVRGKQKNFMNKENWFVLLDNSTKQKLTWRLRWQSSGSSHHPGQASSPTNSTWDTYITTTGLANGSRNGLDRWPSSSKPHYTDQWPYFGRASWEASSWLYHIYNFIRSKW